MDTQSKLLHILFLLLVPLLFGELVIANTSILSLADPITLFGGIAFYGCGALLIRELRARWNLGWSILFLGAAYGIIEEGIGLKSFFNVGNGGALLLDTYGFHFGVQWVWTVMLILFHASMSTLLPIALADQFWPGHRDTPLLGSAAFISAAGMLLGVTTLGSLSWGNFEGDAMIPFYPHPIMIVGCVVAVLVLGALAYRLRHSHETSTESRIASPRVIMLAGFLFQTWNGVLPFVLKALQVSSAVSLVAQGFLAVWIVYFARFQLFNTRTRAQHIFSFCKGNLLFWIALSPVCYSLNGDPFIFLVNGLLLYALVRFGRNNRAWLLQVPAHTYNSGVCSLGTNNKDKSSLALARDNLQDSLVHHNLQ